MNSRRALAVAAVSIWAGGLAASAEPVRVNGHDLTVQQVHMLELIAHDVIPALPGSSTEERVETAARATWWSLREGVLSDWNLRRVPAHQFSSCSRTLKGKNCTKKLQSNECREYDCLLKPLEVCDIGKAWQVGLAAVQAYTPQASWLDQERRVLRAVTRCWSGHKSIEQVLREAADLAQLKPAEKAVVTSLGPGPLRTSWLLRHPVVGFSVVVEQEVTPECFPPQGPATRPGDCFNRGGEGQFYAATPEDAQRSLNDLKLIFRSRVNSN
jgi:hypothetical protein